MKLRIRILSAFSLFAAVGIFILSGCGGGDDGFSPDKLNSLEGERLDQNLKAYFSSGNLPAGEEKTFLIWSFQKDIETTEKYVREFSDKIANLPWYLSDGEIGRAHV